MAVAVLLATAPAAADPGARDAADVRQRHLELSGFVGVDYFGSDIELGNSWAPEQVPGTSVLVGGRLSWIALPDVLRRGAGTPRLDLGVELEARLAAGYTGDDEAGGRQSYFAPVFGWRAHGLARLAGASRYIAPHLVLGGGGESVTSSSPFMSDDTDGVVYYGAGATIAVSSRWLIRLDARHGLAPGRTDAVTSTFEVQVGAGARWDFAGGGASRKSVDVDGDGIADADDKCPTEPETRNGFDDKDGCPDKLDQDHDGIADADDKCPWDAEDKNGIDDTDGCPDPDDDHDGLVGSRDACPNQPEDRDAFKDDDGCPDLDNDGDAIDDMHDACPIKAETWNGITDDDGCPDAMPAQVKAFEGPLLGVKFQDNKARILPISEKTLSRVLVVLREYPQLKIKLEGHTDKTGDRMENMALSKRRAEAVKWYLADRGVMPDRIVTEGVGPDRPVDNGKTGPNARVELHFVAITPPSAPQPSTPKQ